VSAGDRPRIEAVRVGHVFEPVDAVGLAPREEPEATHGLLVTAQEMSQDVLDGPTILSARAKDFPLG
jgi:hypothetical protein